MNKIASPFLYNVFDLSDYDEVVFETMRGCPFSCSYCFYGGGESKLRFFSLERIKKELLVIKRQGGPRSCEFTDSNFNLPQRLNELYPILREVNSDHYFTFRAEINPEFVTEKQIEIFKELNVLNIEVGIQSTNPLELHAINRKFNIAKVEHTIKLLKDSGLNANYHLIIGLPHQTKESFIESNKFLIENGVGDRVNSFLLQVIPGTELREKASDLGLIYSEYPPYFVNKTDKLTNKDINWMVDYRSKLIITQQIKKKEGTRYLQNFELLRFNSYFNLSYEGLNHRNIKVKYTQDLKPILSGKVIERIVFKEAFVNNYSGLTLDNCQTGVFNQIIFEGNTLNIENICSILYWLFKDNPYSCSDIVFYGDYTPKQQEIKQIYYVLGKVLRPFEYVEIERTRKRIEFIHLQKWDGKENKLKSSNIFDIKIVTLSDSSNVKEVVNNLRDKNIHAVLFDNSNIYNWNTINKQLKEISIFNKENNYVFFDNIKIQQYYIKNYIYNTTNSRLTKYPFGYHDGEISMIYEEDFINFKETIRYPFER